MSDLVGAGQAEQMSFGEEVGEAAAHWPPAAEKKKEEPQPLPPVRLKEVNRQQMLLRAVDVEQLVGSDHPIRARWSLVCGLDLQKVEEAIRAREGQAGRPALDPRVLISIWVYAYSMGVGSAREIERLMEIEPGLQWVSGLESICAHTLSDFRVAHGEARQQIFTDVLAVLSEAGMVSLQCVTLDGTKIKAASSPYRLHRQETLERHQAEAQQYLEEVQKQEEDEALSAQAKAARLRGAREKVEKAEQTLRELPKVRVAKQQRGEDGKQAQVSETEPEARKMHHRDGAYAPSYNVQLSTDSKQKVIVSVEVTTSGNDNDAQHLSGALEQIQERLGELPEQMLADSPYTNNNQNILKAKEMGVELYGPGHSESEKQEAGEAENFRAQFQYQSESNSYVCPQGKSLRFAQKRERAGRIHHVYKAADKDCQSCPLKQQCCPKNKGGRTVTRVETDPVVLQFREKMQTEEAQAIYRQRSKVAEFPNLWIKEKMGLRRFHVYGLLKAQSEVLWVALTYNIQILIRGSRQIPSGVG
jgi:transposase